MRRARVDSVEHRGGFGFLFKHGQRGQIGFLVREHFKFLLLPLGLFFRPLARRAGRNSFNPSNARCDRFLSNDAE